MINLAGVKTCDKTIKEELEIAGIEIVTLGKMDGEVPASVIGKCNNFIYTRAWYYWIVTGYMPLKYANVMYEKYKDLNIRVVGHCCNPSPEEWCEPKNYREMCNPIIHRAFNKEISFDEADKICNEIRKNGDQFVTHYHIDTQLGLNKFVEIIKKNKIFG